MCLPMLCTWKLALAEGPDGQEDKGFGESKMMDAIDGALRSAICIRAHGVPARPPDAHRARAWDVAAQQLVTISAGSDEVSWNFRVLL